jgi:hypothetical protein
VQAAVIRKKNKAAKMRKQARAHANKMNAIDVTLQTTLAATRRDLDDEIASFGNAKVALKTYLQDQFKSRVLLHNGVYKTIPTGSEFRRAHRQV